MISERYTSTSPEETQALGERFAGTWLLAGSVVALRGDLGAGKTQFTKGIAKACGIEGRELTSPTFALANEYDCLSPVDHTEHFRLNHLDCYRFENAEELLELGIEDYLYPNHGATVIEWAERIERFLPRPRIEVYITADTEEERTIVISHMHPEE